MTAKSVFVVKLLLLLFMLFSVWACNTIESDVAQGITAKTVGSPDFKFRLGSRIAVLPFSVLGNPDRTIDISEADKLSMKLREIGFVIVESLMFQGDDSHLQGLIHGGDWEAVTQVFDVDYLVFGTINYTYHSGHSLAGKGYYYGSSASVRLVDMQNGEVVIISTTDRVDGSMAEEIGESIANYLFRD